MNEYAYDYICVPIVDLKIRAPMMKLIVGINFRVVMGKFRLYMEKL